jgi:murein DD-endopeptidase MepM/ murein hydrolase activator NlpD
VGVGADDTRAVAGLSAALSDDRSEERPGARIAHRSEGPTAGPGVDWRPGTPVVFRAVTEAQGRQGGRLIVRPARRGHGFTALIALTTLFLALSLAAVAQAAQLPGRPTPGSLAAGAPPESEGAVGAASAPLTSLSVGSRGEYVRLLQTALRKRGLRVSVDGSYGAGTRSAVRKMQKRLKMRTSGVATVSFLRKLGIKQASPAPTGQVSITGSGRYLRAFPVGGRTYSYSNDFGAPRHQGAHQGIDIIAPRGAPIISPVYGRIQRLTRVETGLGGLWIWIVDRQGNEYYFAHLDSIAAGLTEGTEVWPGRVIGTNGNTGDARYGVEHLHFEVHPGGGGAWNPYTDLVTVDPKRKAKAASARAAARR